MAHITHMRASIEGLLQNFKRKKITFMLDDDGRPMSDKQARAEIKRLQYLGHKYIPCGKCEGFDPFENGCPGHDMPEESEIENAAE